MDVTDIGRVASRKRMNTDAEKLREKVSRETAKIIKLKVAQDTAYWDLKERLQQLQGAHERLQQNMVDVQMQHEAASAHYTQELRLRPDTLNKAAGARGVCDVLEEYGARLRRCVARCRADRGALQAAYAQAGARVRGLAAELGRAREARASQRDAVREGAARAVEQVRQLEAAHEQLGAARARADEHAAARDQLAARLRQVSVEQVRQLEAAHEQLGAARARADEHAAARDQLAARLRQVSVEQVRQLEAAHEQLGAARARADEHAAARDQLAARLRQVSVEQVRQLEAAHEQLGAARARADEHAAARDQLAARLRQVSVEQVRQLEAAHEQLGAARARADEHAAARDQLAARLRQVSVEQVRQLEAAHEQLGAARARADEHAAARDQLAARLRQVSVEQVRQLEAAHEQLGAARARADEHAAARDQLAARLRQVSVEQVRQLEAAHEQLGAARARADEHAAARDQLAARLRQVSVEQVRQLEAAHEQLGAARARADEHAAARDQLAARLRQVSVEQVRQLEAAHEQLGAARARADEHAAARDQLAARLRQVSVEQVRQLEAAHEQLGAARARADEHAAARDQLAARLRQADDAAAAMRDEVSRLVSQFDAQTAHMQQTIARQADEARAAGAEGARLRRDAAALHDELRRAHQQLADAKNAIDHMKQKEATHVDEIKSLEKVIHDKNQHEQEMETEISYIKQCVRQLETEKLEASEKLNKSEQDCGALRTALDELTRAADQLRARLDEQQAAHQAQRDADSAQRAELGAAVAAKDRELDANTGTIARLMTDLKSESDARARADAALGAARRQHDAEQLAARAREQQLRDAAACLERALQAKDDELGAQMTIILDIRGEKERLQERIQGMQNTIDNIQKELTGRLAAPKGAADTGEPPELDAGPHKARPRQAELYSFLSDGSADGDALDPREVGRRFEALARGELRGARAAAQGSISLSQVKDDLKIKSRTFFKNKRFDSKPKKFK